MIKMRMNEKKIDEKKIPSRPEVYKSLISRPDDLHFSRTQAREDYCHGGVGPGLERG